MNKKVKDLIAFITVITCTIILELALNKMNVYDENIYLVFVLAILIIIIETKSILYGLLGTFITVMSFNFFITAPKYSFVVDDTNNYVSFIMFAVVTFMVNSLVIQLQRQIRISTENEKKINTLYKFSTDFLHAKDIESSYDVLIRNLSDQFSCNVGLIDNDGKVYGIINDLETIRNVLDYSRKNNIVISSEMPQFANLQKVIFPITSQLRRYGTLVIESDEVDREFVENVLEELLVNLDKNYISNVQEKTRIQVEKEKYKTSLLRGLSHDLKTPLTMIQSGSNFLMDSYDSISVENQKSLIKDIYEESNSLSSFVNNLLDLTKLEDESIIINRKKEAVDDILSEVNEKIKPLLENHQLLIHSADEVLFVNADVSLLSQVFINLIENAIHHTRSDSVIEVNYHKTDEGICFTVSDNGGGIDENKLENLFDTFHAITENRDRRRSHGLGLSICKSIIEVHGGSIKAYNNSQGGATFEFTIPDVGGNHE